MVGRREEIIVATSALQERAHAKSVALIEAMAALVERGLPRPSGLLAAQIGMARFSRGINAWGGGSASELEGLIASATAEVRALG